MNQNAINFETKTVTISLAEYHRFMATQKAKDIADRKKNAGQNFFVRRQALVLRWVNQEEIAPDTHVLAYDSVHNLKKNDHEAKGTYEDRMKISVADEEIYGFLALEDDGHWYEDITIKQVEERAAVIKAAKDKAAKDKAKNKAKSENDVAGDHQASKSEDVGAEGGKVLEITDYTVEDETLDLPASEIGTDKEDSAQEGPLA